MGSLRSSVVLAVALGLAMAAPANAAPAEQADCALGQLAEEQRLLLGDSMIGSDAQRPSQALPEGLAEARIGLETALKACTAKHGWSQDRAAIALSYSFARMTAEVARYYIHAMGADIAAADLFFAQNKYQILDERAAGYSSREWANLRLIELGFAKEKSDAYNAVWLYFDMLFRIDAEREAFVIGQMPEPIK
jgi:hypothetical protein